MSLPILILPYGLRPSNSDDVSWPTAPSTYHESFSTLIPVHMMSVEVSSRLLKGVPSGMLEMCSNSPYHVHPCNSSTANKLRTNFKNGLLKKPRLPWHTDGVTCISGHGCPCQSRLRAQGREPARRECVKPPCPIKPAFWHTDGYVRFRAGAPLPKQCRLVGTRTARAWSGVIAASQTGLPKIIPKKRCWSRPLLNQRRPLCPVCLRIYGTFFRGLLQHQQSTQNFPL